MGMCDASWTASTSNVIILGISINLKMYNES